MENKLRFNSLYFIAMPLLIECEDYKNLKSLFE